MKIREKSFFKAVSPSAEGENSISSFSINLDISIPPPETSNSTWDKRQSKPVDFWSKTAYPTYDFLHDVLFLFCKTGESFIFYADVWGDKRNRKILTHD